MGRISRIYVATYFKDVVATCTSKRAFIDYLKFIENDITGFDVVVLTKGASYRNNSLCTMSARNYLDANIN